MDTDCPFPPSALVPSINSRLFASYASMISAVERLSLLVIFIFTLISLPTEAVGSENAILLSLHRQLSHKMAKYVYKTDAATAAAHCLICFNVMFIPAFLNYFGLITARLQW